MNKIIETDRLYLRELTIDDFDEYYKILSDSETMKYYPKPFDKEQVIKWINWNIKNYETYGFGLWAVILKEEDVFIGACGITLQHINGKILPEVGFHISKNYWNNGYATEAAKACLEYAFTKTTYDEIYCYQKYTNKPSQHVAMNIGLKYKMEYEDEANKITTVYSILKEDYKK